MLFDYRIVGAGLTGAVLARTLTDAGFSVHVVERREHVAGNVHDTMHACGMPMHAFGPHYFRTSSDAIWEFVTRFATFYRFEAELRAEVNGRLENWPISAEYISRTSGPDWQPAFRGVPGNFEEASLALMPSAVYERFVKEYTEKQWGVAAHTLEASLSRRFDIRTDGDPRLKLSKHQGLPRGGYTAWVASMLRDVKVNLGVDYLSSRMSFPPAAFVIFTGPIDEYFAYCLGRLEYRGQRREHVYFDGADFLQPVPQINYPRHAQGARIRTIEWKHLLDPALTSRPTGSLITTETPFTPSSPTDYEYPFPDARNARLYREYRTLSETEPDTLICGRLGEYRYFDMDQAIARALLLAKRLLAQRAPRAELHERGEDKSAFLTLQRELLS